MRDAESSNATSVPLREAASAAASPAGPAPITIITERSQYSFHLALQ